MERFAVVGLGYVGLPVALGFARRFAGTVGFDIDRRRVEELQRGHDRTREFSQTELAQSDLSYTYDLADLGEATFYVVCVPTPIDDQKKPDLGALRSASRTVGQVLKPGDVVVYESTVYPGVTEEICRPILAEVSGLTAGVDFTVGYSPERINPGDKEHTLERITKVVSGEDEATLDRVAAAYGAIVHAGVHRAPSVRVAEAAKVIENTQRDLNIALMNELAILFERLGIPTRDVLAAAGTKWNFLRFTPGLVGGHCIGVDPYYLTTKAESVGYHPQVILAGRRINDRMGRHVAECVVKGLAHQGRVGPSARVGILGLTFKENVPDLRNSRVPDIVDELREYGIEPMVHDPTADPDEARHELGLEITPLSELIELDAIVLAVSHTEYLADGGASVFARVRPGGLVFDVKAVIDRDTVPDGVRYACL